MPDLSKQGLSELKEITARLEAVPAQYERTLNNVLNMERQISAARMDGLDEFFDAFEKGMLLVFKRVTGDFSSNLEDIQQDFVAGMSQAATSAEKATQPKRSGGAGGKGGGNKGNSGSAGDGGDQVVTEIYNTQSSEEVKEGNEQLEKSVVAAQNLYAFMQKSAQTRSLHLDEVSVHVQDIDAAWTAINDKHKKSINEQATSIQNSITELAALSAHQEDAVQNRVEEMKMAGVKKVADAELNAQKARIEYLAQYEMATKIENVEAEWELNENARIAAEQEKSDKARAERLAKEKARLELHYAKKTGGVLTKEDAARIARTLASKYKAEEENEKKLAKRKKNLAKQAGNDAKIAEEKINAEERGKLREQNSALTAKGASLAERKKALYNLTHNEDGDVDAGKAISAAILMVSDLAKQLEAKIDEIAGKKTDVDTRLQGSKNETVGGSYWAQLQRDMISVGAVNPYFKQETFASNIEELVKKGIAFDIKQRAFLMTVQNKIASTFEVTNETLLRLVRIQQQDSTAGRMGMESALNAFLNEMYETSEYLSDVAKTVKTSLEEMEALMEGAAATEVEFQIQKWLGSLYSVGMSSDAAQSIASSLGQIAAGQIEGLDSGAGNLLIMAANNAGIPIADILTKGIDSNQTNELLKSAVNYLSELAESAEDNKVVQQQLANVFGVKASDLRAVQNLVLPGSIDSVSAKNLTYAGMIDRLTTMANSMGKRTSMAEKMTNIWDNASYTMAASIASSPIAYFIYKVASVVDDAAGGIDLPFLNVMGFGVDLNTTVSDLMRLASVGIGLFGSMGDVISGLGNSFSGQSMLQKLGIKGSVLATVSRGGGAETIGAAGGSTSESGSMAGNSSGSDIKDSTIQESEDSKKQQMVEAKEEAEANQVDMLNETVLKIYELLDDVAKGKSSFKVQVDGYGLTKGGGGSQSGIAALTSNAFAAGGATDSGSSGGGIDFGSWTSI